jgi:hypothetical protein
MTAPKPLTETAISAIAAILRLSYEDELTDSVRNQLRGYAVIVRSCVDDLRDRVRELEVRLEREMALSAHLAGKEGDDGE